MVNVEKGTVDCNQSAPNVDVVVDNCVCFDNNIISLNFDSRQEYFKRYPLSIDANGCYYLKQNDGSLYRIGFLDNSKMAFYDYDVNNNNTPVWKFVCTNRGIMNMQSYYEMIQNAQSKDKKNRGKHLLNINSKVRTLAIKIYVEQMVYGWEYTKKAIIAMDKDKYQVIGICHDRDIIVYDYWLSAKEKPHYHIIIRVLNDKSVRVLQMLKELGIEFRPYQDDILLEKHGLETIRTYEGYAVYLTHDTEKAKLEGKEHYEMEELISNLTLEEIQHVRDGYVKVSANAHKVTASDLIELDEKAYELGYNMKNFNTWYNAMPFVVRSHTKVKTIRESYERGVATRVEEHQTIVRMCCFIEGEPDVGKTYGAEKAVTGEALIIKGGGSGKFDRLRPDHNALIFDDDICPNLLNMSDNYICYAYRRNSNNRPWSGQHFIVTSNISFEKWVEDCGIDINGKHFDAIKSRFYICKVVQDKATGLNRLKCTSVSTRGTVAEQQQRLDLFMEFKRKFDDTLATYHTNNGTVDYSKVLDGDSDISDNPLMQKFLNI